MPDDGLVRSIKRFDGKNFQAWKFQVTAVLMANEIFDVVDGTREKPVNMESAYAGLTKVWIKDNAKATAIIASAMEDEQVNNVLVCDTAKAMWDKLTTIHEQKSASNVGALTQRFYAYKMSLTDKVVQHVSAIQNMASQLRDLGEPISDAAIVAKMLSSLTPKFSVFKTAWDSVDPKKQTMTHLLERLIREDSNIGEEGDSASALAVTKQASAKGGMTSRGNKKKKSKANIECFRCQEKGHYASQCGKKSQGEKNTNKPSGNCAFVVGTNEDNEGMQQERKRQQLLSIKEIRQLRDADKRDVWITDSEALKHITSRRDWFEEIQPVIESVVVGNDGVCDVARASVK